MGRSSSSAPVSERPSCLAASSHSAFDVTLSQSDPLATLMYPLGFVGEVVVVVVAKVVVVAVALVAMMVVVVLAVVLVAVSLMQFTLSPPPASLHPLEIVFQYFQDVTSFGQSLYSFV